MGVDHKKTNTLLEFVVVNGYNVSISARLHLNRRISDCNFIPIYNFAIPGADSARWILSAGARAYTE
jgi:hypothetical protein